MTSSHENDYRDSRSLVKWTKRFVYAQAAVACVAFITGIREYSVLTWIRDDRFESYEILMTAAERSDAWRSAIGLIQVIVLAVSAILILRWIHRVNSNARALGAGNLRFTPAWSVGWFFVPIFNLWKPYQAMKEIWKASSNPADWHSQAAPSILAVWWALWLAWVWISNAAFRLLLRAEEVSELIIANVATLVADAVTVPLCIVFVLLMSRVHSMQNAAFHSSEVVGEA